MVPTHTVPLLFAHLFQRCLCVCCQPSVLFFSVHYDCKASTCSAHMCVAMRFFLPYGMDRKTCFAEQESGHALATRLEKASCHSQGLDEIHNVCIQSNSSTMKLLLQWSVFHSLAMSHMLQCITIPSAIAPFSLFLLFNEIFTRNKSLDRPDHTEVMETCLKSLQCWQL